MTGGKNHTGTDRPTTPILTQLGATKKVTGEDVVGGCLQTTPVVAYLLITVLVFAEDACFGRPVTHALPPLLDIQRSRWPDLGHWSGPPWLLRR